MLALINTAAILDKVIDLQPHGQRDKRHFDNLIWTLPIPEYDNTDQVHRDLADAAERAELIAAAIDLTEINHFTAKRRAIREALAADAVAQTIESLVDAILPTQANLICLVCRVQRTPAPSRPLVLSQGPDAERF